MDKQREKLIELIIKGSIEYANSVNSDGYMRYVADYLLANGVIVPPCKVGDIVYFDCCGYHDSAEIDGINITAQGINFTWVQYDVGVDITELWDEGEFDIDEIGKTVFLSREDAEKALRKEDESND